MNRYSYLLIGAGEQTQAVAFLLASCPDTKHITIADVDDDRAHDLCTWLLKRLESCRFRLNRIDSMELDAFDEQQVAATMAQGFDAVINCAGNEMNLGLARAAIAAGIHYVDIGQVPEIIEQQMRLDADAKAAGVRIVPACGIAPGASAIVLAHAMQQLDGEPTAIRIRCGGIPQVPKGLFQYRWAFSTAGLLTEYALPMEAIHKGARYMALPLSGLETLDMFGIGTLEAATTGGNTGTLVQSLLESGYRGDFDYKTLRHPGHWELMRLFQRLGAFEEQAFIQHMEQELLRYKADPDFLVLHVAVENENGFVAAELVDRMDEHGLSAMQRTTGFSAAIIARMLVDGTVTATGALRQERDIPVGAFLQEWQRQGITLSVKTSRWHTL